MSEISLYAVVLSLSPLLGVCWIAHRWSNGALEVALATMRMLVQLLLVGFILVAVFESQSILTGLIVLTVMILASGAIAVRTTKRERMSAFLKAAFSIAVVGLAVLAFLLIGVLRLDDPLNQPRFAIPLAGMIFSASMTAITLATERLDRELETGVDFAAAHRAAWSAAIIPQVNGFLAVGLVSLPGMMTGQILSGVEPLVAVRYQIVVMSMILQCSGLSVALYLWLSYEGSSAQGR